MAIRPEIKAERRLREVMVHNTSQRLARIVDRLNDIDDIDDINSAKYKRVHREMMRAAEQVATAVVSPISDSALLYFDGEEAVQDRADAARKRGLGKVVSLAFRSK